MKTILSPANPADKSESWKMFNRIAPSYDLLNRLLSLGIDQRWRKKLADYLPAAPGKLKILDLATGTGDQLLALLKVRPERFAAAVGADPAEKMLAGATTKPIPRGAPTPEWMVAPVEALPFKENSFDLLTISFGIRNLADPGLALQEMRRVLRPGGRLLVLEFSLPTNRIVLGGYLFYFRHLLPLLGGWVSGQPAAYRYLNQTVEEFPYGEAFLSLLVAAEFSEVGKRELTGGIATIYWADKLEQTEVHL